MRDLSRRGLLGLMAAAPVAAVAKSHLRDVHGAPYGIDGAGKVLDNLVISVDTSHLEADLNQVVASVKRANPQILWDDPECGITPTHGQTYEMPDGSRAIAGESSTNHPLLNAPADDEGPGAPADVRDASGAPPSAHLYPNRSARARASPATGGIRNACRTHSPQREGLLMADRRTIELADKITTMAEGALHRLDVVIRDWPGDFRAIMWEAVADIASRRAASARMKEAENANANGP